MSSPRRPHRLHERQQTTKTNDTVATYQYVYIYHDRYKHTVSIRRARLAVAKRDSAKIKNFSVKFRKGKHAAETRKVDWKSQSNRWITLSSLFFNSGDSSDPPPSFPPHWRKVVRISPKLTSARRLPNAISCSSDPRLGLSETLL